MENRDRQPNTPPVASGIQPGQRVVIVGRGRLNGKTATVVGLEWHAHVPGGKPVAYYRVNSINGLPAKSSYLLKQWQVREAN